MKDPERTFFQEISLLNLAEEGAQGGGGGGVSHIKRRVQEGSSPNVTQNSPQKLKMLLRHWINKPQTPVSKASSLNILSFSWHSKHDPHWLLSFMLCSC